MATPRSSGRVVVVDTLALLVLAFTCAVAIFPAGATAAAADFGGGANRLFRGVAQQPRGGVSEEPPSLGVVLAGDESAALLGKSGAIADRPSSNGTLLSSDELMEALTAAFDGGGLEHSASSPSPFSFSNCDPTAAIQVVSLKVTDPLPLGGEATVSGEGKVSRDVSAPVSTSVTLEKEFFTKFVKIPCLPVQGKQVGSCDYEDVCALINHRSGDPCPAPLGPAGIPCACPVSAGDYTLPPSTISLVVPKELPKELGEGNYRASVSQSDALGVVSCVRVAFSVTKEGGLHVA